MVLSPSTSTTSTSTSAMSDGSSQSSSTNSTHLETVQLEALAEDLQKQLEESHLIQDRQYQHRTIPQSFLGSDVVTVLVGLLRDDDPAATRQQALQVGRTIAETFGFFVHANAVSVDKQMALQDSASHIYRFQNNLPIQVHQVKKQYPSLWDKVRVWEQNLPTFTHRGGIPMMQRTFHDCFPAKVAIDTLVQVKLVRSRREGVHMMRKMMEKVRCCRPVLLLVANMPLSAVKDDFQDNEQIYQLVPHHDRLTAGAEPHRSCTVSAAAASSSSSSLTHSPPSSFSNRSMTSSSRSKSSKKIVSLSPKRAPRRHTGTNKTQSHSQVSSERQDSPLDGGSSMVSEPKHSSSSSSSSRRSTVKNGSYYQNRAVDVRSRLDVYRDQRRAASAASSNKAAIAA